MLLFNNNYKKKKITLLIHSNPDGDALGSSLALFIYFKKLQNDVFLISPTEYYEYFNWLPYSKNITIFSNNNKYLIKEKIYKSDYIFFIDFNNIIRLGDLKNFLSFSKKSKKVLIDHHPFSYNNFNFDFILSDIKVAATSILVFRFIYNNIKNKYSISCCFDKNIATCLYVGLITDTGFFKFSSKISYETYFTAGKLLKIGIDIDKIHNKLQEKYTESRLRLLSIALRRLKIMKEYRIAYTSINSLDIKKKSYIKGDTEGIVNYGLNIENIILSVFFFEKNKKCPIKISFRSKENFDVNLFSRKFFKGGGHKNAAGAIVIGKSLCETINYFLCVIKKYYKNIMFST